MNPVRRGKTADLPEFSKSSFAMASAATIDAFASSAPIRAKRVRRRRFRVNHHHDPIKIRAEVPAAGIGAGAVRAAERPVTTIRVVAPAVVLFSTVSVLIFTQPQSFNSADNAGTAEVMDSRAITSRTTLGPIDLTASSLVRLRRLTQRII
jgi:hypothetical protein